MNQTKQQLSGLLIAMYAFISCQQKSIPVITTRATTPDKKPVSIYADPGTVLADTVQGRSVFISACHRCHGLPDINIYSASQWEDVLERMIPRTRMGRENAVHVRAYILSKAKQP